MSNIVTKRVDGDASVMRNASIGGDVNVSGSMTLGHDLEVKGRLIAQNIDTANKGVFSSLSSLQSTYPKPKAGWYANVGTGRPYTVYTVENGAWTRTEYSAVIDVNTTDTAAINDLTGRLAAVAASGSETATELGLVAGQVSTLLQVVKSLFPSSSIKTLTVDANDGARGTVTGGGTYVSGSKAILRATAKPGYMFQQWSDGSTDPVRSILVEADTDLTAYFINAMHTVTVTSSNKSLGTATVSADRAVVYGGTVTIDATPKIGAVFTGWYKDGSLVSTSGKIQVTVTCDVLYTAMFDVVTYQVAVSANDGSMGTVTGSGEYAHGSQAKLIATAKEGHKFVSWKLGGSVVSTNSSYTFAVTSNATFVAVFETSGEEADEGLSVTSIDDDGDACADGETDMGDGGTVTGMTQGDTDAGDAGQDPANE